MQCQTRHRCVSVGCFGDDLWLMTMIGILVGNLASPWVGWMLSVSLGDGTFSYTIRDGAGSRGDLGACVGVGTLGGGTGDRTLIDYAISGSVEGARLRSLMGVCCGIGINGRVCNHSFWVKQCSR